MVIDDEKLIVKGLTNSLEQQNYKVYPAYNGAEALATLEKEK